MLLLQLNGVRRQRRQQEMAEAIRTSSPASSVAKCFVRDKPWVTPSLNHMDEQELEGEETGRQ